MPHSKKNSLRKPFTGLLVILLLAFPQISLATSEHPSHQNAPTIIAKDAQSGAVIFQRRGVYYYGLSRAKAIIAAGQIAPGQLIVKYKRQANPRLLSGLQPLRETARRYGVKTQELNGKLGLSLIKLTQNKAYFQTMRELAKNPQVEYVEPNYIVKAQALPNDPYYAFQWGPPLLKTVQAWEMVSPAQRAKVKIAILDSGVNASHPDLKASIVPGYNTVNDGNDTADKLGHGTHVAGIAAASANNGTGIAGIAAGCKIMPVKVLDDEGNGDDASIIKGIKYATDHGAQVINLSLGGPDPSNAIQEAVTYAIGHGVSVVAAAGNENGPIDMPGNCEGVISVGAIDNKGQRASYSNFGPKLDVVAPGSGILSTYIGKGPSGYTYLDGTSMAAPFVTGVAALVKAVNPQLNPAAVKEIIHQSASHQGQGTQGFDNYYGYGVVNAMKAVTLASDMKFRA